jgi:hypothetical protein
VRILKSLVVFAAALVVITAGFLWYMGMFNGVKVSMRNVGPYTYVYESFIGPYKDTGKVFDRVYKELRADGVHTDSAIGIYYDDPNTVKASKLHSDCGCILEEKDLSRLPALLEKYKIKTVGAKMRLAAEFPYRNVLSYMIGPAKVYPVLMSEALKNGSKVVSVFEVYDMTEKKILYVIETQ